jgi:hypothetical protein
MSFAGGSFWPTTPPRPLVAAWSHTAANRADSGFRNRLLNVKSPNPRWTYSAGDTGAKPEHNRHARAKREGRSPRTGLRPRITAASPYGSLRLPRRLLRYSHWPRAVQPAAHDSRCRDCGGA